MAEVNQNDILELAGYLESVKARMTSIEASNIDLSRLLGKHNEGSASVKNRYNEELALIKHELSLMDEEIRSLQKVIVQLISDLKATIKRDDLERFKKRIDMWAPEGMVTRNEARMMIDQYFS
ncbi:hypothetical protein JXB28_05750 [Candidatus Woesearchaeota archaeon]|nr:hypothetical protein [Candidatus Woesearchaeota archaeon]